MSSSVSADLLGKRTILDDSVDSLQSSSGNNLNEEIIVKKACVEKIEIKKPKRKRPPIISRSLEKPEIYVENGLRKVRPYWFKFMSSVKQRWENRTLADILPFEFHGKNPDFFQTAIKLGRLKINEEITSIDYCLYPTDVLTNIAHRHELPILDRKPKIVVDNDDVLVIDKPCSLPVHPCGRYFFNSLTKILKNEYGYETLRLMHRLDRLTSGLIIIAKNVKTDLKLKHEVTNRLVEKEYVCMVEGQFPSGPIECTKSIDVCYAKMGVQWVLKDDDPKGKECLTRFELIKTDCKVSLVRCRPKTGRTHQIRVHLQYLGYPIIDDYMYNNKVWGETKGKHGDYGGTHEEICEALKMEFAAENWVLDFDQSLDNFNKHRQKMDDNEIGLQQQKQISNEQDIVGVPELDESLQPENKSTLYDPYCIDCHVEAKIPTEKQLELHLHCLRYKGPDWEYETEMPDWGTEFLANSSSCDEKR